MTWDVARKLKAEPFKAEDYKYDTKWTSWNQWPQEGGYSDEWNTWTKDEYDDPALWESGNWDTSECNDAIFFSCHHHTSAFLA